MNFPFPVALRFTSILCLFALLSSASFAQNKTIEDKAKQIWQMLDYIGVDYAGAVEKGKVISQEEYAEMVEFSRNVEAQIKELPEADGKSGLLRASAELRKSIDGKAAVEAVAKQARSLADALIASYPIPVAPGATPNLKLGATIYQTNCASCHGAEGKADTPMAAKLNPPPIAFSDPQRARERSVLSLYQTTTQGVDGTAMPSFSSLSEEERWAVAYFASTLSYSDQEREQGAALWSSNPGLKENIKGIGGLTQLSEAALSSEVEAASARHVLAYLRSNPQVLEVSKNDSIAIAQAKLKESLSMLEKGDRSNAGKLELIS